MSLCSPLQEMAGRALKQTGSRSIEAALEFISKMGYLEPGKEQIVRVVKQTSPGEHAGGYGEAAVGRGPHGHHAAPPSLTGVGARGLNLPCPTSYLPGWRQIDT